MADGRRPPHSGGGELDEPTVGDHQRIRRARHKARLRRREIEAASAAGLLEAFRAELGATIRSASPVLIALLAIEGLSLDDAVEILLPPYGWPSRPWLFGSGRAPSAKAHYLRHVAATRGYRSKGGPPRQITRPPLVECRFERADGGELTLGVVDHSLELNALFGTVRVETRFGEMIIELAAELPAAMLAACVGGPLETSSMTRRGADVAGGSLPSRKRTTRSARG